MPSSPGEVAIGQRGSVASPSPNEADTHHVRRLAAAPTMSHLTDRYLAWLHAKGCQERYINDVEGMINT